MTISTTRLPWFDQYSHTVPIYKLVTSPLCFTHTRSSASSKASAFSSLSYWHYYSGSFHYQCWMELVFLQSIPIISLMLYQMLNLVPIYDFTCCINKLIIWNEHLKKVFNNKIFENEIFSKIFRQSFIISDFVVERFVLKFSIISSRIENVFLNSFWSCPYPMLKKLWCSPTRWWSQSG